MAVTESFRPIRNDRLSDKAVDQIIRLIRVGELPVGTKLPNEAQLAQQLGVSRGILREAFTVLEAQGYISRAPREGTIVKRANGRELGAQLSSQLRAARYRELLEFREVMECRAVQNAIKLADDEAFARLQMFISEKPEAELPNSPDYYFHYHLAELSGNSLFMVFIDMYYDLIQEMATVSYKDKKRLRQQNQEHQQIMDALLKRDARAAVVAVRNHLRMVQRSVESNSGKQESV